ncbi:MAG TPA: hypothetical protein VK524_26050, partial [Polyangiaceae bacterium]|nr:hypothetical protein [Polyangiaceae bacterium]
TEPHQDTPGRVPRERRATSPEGSRAQAAPSSAIHKPAKTQSEPAAEPAPAPAEPSRPAVTAPFDKNAAVSVLNSLAAQASACRQAGDPTGTATVVITFAPSGRITNATLNGPPFAGTATGGCVARTLRRAQVPAFKGDHVTVSKTVLLQ